MRVRLKGIKSARVKNAAGRVVTYYYHRATGKRLIGEPGTAEFIAALEEAGRASIADRGQDTVSGLIRAYCTSSQWRKLADSTRAIAALNLKAVEDKWGKVPLKVACAQTARRSYLKWHDELAERHPSAADSKVGALARVFSWGCDRGYVPSNPISTFPRAYKAKRAELIWLPGHVAAFQVAASPELTLALLVAMHTGQRQGDLLRLEWAAYDGKAISLRQGKTGRRVWLPCTIALRTALDAAPRRAKTILTRPSGEPWTKDSFTWAWAQTFKASGLTDDLHFHDLRGTAVTMLNEAGCTPQEVASITGWTVKSVDRIIDVYGARTKALAQSAITKLETHLGRDESDGKVGKDDDKKGSED